MKNASNSSQNYEYLFNLTDENGGPPKASSLFNLDTLKLLIDLGYSVPDISINKTSELIFNDTWDELTTNLGLDHNEQTYMIFLWLKYAA